VKFSYLQPFIEHSLTVRDSDGKPVPQPQVIPDIGEYQPGEVELPPGKEIELHELKRKLRSAKWLGNDRVPSLYGTGKFILQYEQVLGTPSMGVPGWKLDAALSKLATGKLELEIKADPPGAANVLGSSAGRGHAQPAREAVEKRIAVKFDKAPWAEVLKWYSDQTGLPLISEHRPPPGSFSHVTPKGATYSVHEMTIVLNERLLKQGYVLVPRRQSVVMLKIAK
jgi:hypothetical protein